MDQSPYLIAALNVLKGMGQQAPNAQRYAQQAQQRQQQQLLDNIQTNIPTQIAQQQNTIAGPQQQPIYPNQPIQPFGGLYNLGQKLGQTFQGGFNGGN